MTSFSSPQLPGQGSPTLTRVKWDNIAIVLFGLVLAAFAVVAILMSGDEPASRPAKQSPAALETTDAAPAEAALSLDEAIGLADEARALMGEARWDEAADRLATIPAEHRAATGAEALEQQLEEMRETHDTLRAELGAAVEARQWQEASAILRKLAKIATLDAPLLEVQSLVAQAIDGPAAQESAAEDDPPARPRKRSQASGGGTAASSATAAGPTSASTHGSAARPAAGSTRPTGSRPRPAATTAGGRPAVPPTAPAGTIGAGTPNGSGAATAPSGGMGDIAGGVQLTAAQQQELEAALAKVLEGLEL